MTTTDKKSRQLLHIDHDSGGIRLILGLSLVGALVVLLGTLDIPQMALWSDANLAP